MANRPAPIEGHKIATMAGVREHTEREPVELWVNSAGRSVIRAYNECGNNYTDVDLGDLLNWMCSGSVKGGIHDGTEDFPSLPSIERN